MNKSTVFGLILAVGSLIVSGAMELNHLNPEGISPFLKPSALIMIFGATAGATMCTVSWELFMKLPTITRIAFKEVHFDSKGIVPTFVSFSEKARKEGLLALEEDIEQTTDLFLKKGLQLVVDGVDPEVVRGVLESEIDNTKARHKEGADMFTAMGGFAPTMGIVGTVLGLIAALTMAGQGAESNKVVGAIATAFIATFYGIGGANLVFLPIGGKLTQLDHHEAQYRELVSYGILSIMSGDNPRIVQEKLSVFLSEGDRVDLEKKEEGE
ncbi:MAG TPA: MotA/TolQ/ExbB proton channel family protein [bacterium]|nr:MotA/TolQ/ExbB proton channel family protein [bacterium]